MSAVSLWTAVVVAFVAGVSLSTGAWSSRSASPSVRRLSAGNYVAGSVCVVFAILNGILAMTP